MGSGPTGRLTRTVSERTRRLLFDADWADAAGELDLITQVDLAHLVMLRRQDLIGSEEASALAHEIGALRADGFEPLRGVPAPRGLYLMYEGQLIARLGDEVAGRLHTGRSRNDVKATTTLLRLRSELLDIAGESVRLQAVLLARARRHRSVVMPVYTHFQAAMPITYGHYLLGVAMALGRAIGAVRQAADGIRRCPMGACAVAGTDLPIDPQATARLLGFDAGPAHAVDAVASRDVVLQALAAVTGIGLAVSRMATDLQLWSTAEFGLIEFGDRLVGGSSAMPQKRNAFILEHLKAAAGAAIGAWTAAAGMTKSTPFTNTIEVGTEAVGAAWPGFAAVAKAVLLAQAVSSGADPVPARMQERAREGFIEATSIANQLVRSGVPFRTAHEAVGAAVREALERGATCFSGDEDWGVGEVAVETGLHGIVEAAAAGGGPGAFDDAFAVAREEISQHAAWCRQLRARVESAQRAVMSVVAAAADPGDIARAADG